MSDHDEDSDGFITLPPGLFDSGTIKVPQRAERPTHPEPAEIVFVPTVPGAVPVLPPQPVAPPSPPSAEPPRPPEPTWSVHLPDGRVVTVRKSVVLGRGPSAIGEWEGAETVSLGADQKSVSKTHAALEVEGGLLWVHDLNSTNGSWVVVTEDDVTEVVPGRRVQVPPGASLELGDVAIRVDATR